MGRARGHDGERGRLVADVGVAVVPGSSFYHDPALGRTQVRFTFCKRDETLQAAGRRLAAIPVPAQASAP